MKPTAEPPIMISRQQVARLLDVCTNTVIALEKDGTLKPVRLRNSVKHRRADIEAKMLELALAV